MENRLELKLKERWKRCQEWKTYVNYCGLYYKKECPMNCAYALYREKEESLLDKTERRKN